MTIYINTQHASIDELNKLLQDIADGKRTATAHATRAGGLAFDTQEKTEKKEN